MLRRCSNNEEDAQVFLEYVIIVSVVILVLVAMSTLIKRGTQGMIKVVADEIGFQANAEQNAEEGYLKYSNVLTRTRADKRTLENVGDTVYAYDDEISATQSAIINLGFTEEK